MVWLGTLQKSLDPETSELQACSLRAFWDGELTGTCGLAGAPTESLDSEASELPGQTVNGNCVETVGLTEKLGF